MSRSASQETDSGSYVGGVYTSKNGNVSGINCPKGSRLYDPNMKPAIYFQPPDTGETEEFVPLTREAAKDVVPNYAISNYGRMINMYTGKIIKPASRPSGYEYYTLPADNSGPKGQKKYCTHRLVMGTFNPVEGMDALEVRHINGDKSDNYVNKTMPDGSVQSNLEWCTEKERKHRNHQEDDDGFVQKLTKKDATIIRALHDSSGYSYARIRDEYYPNVTEVTIQRVCRNQTFKDENYKPKDSKRYYNVGGNR